MKLAQPTTSTAVVGSSTPRLRRPKLHGLGTATPLHRMSQAESLQMFTDIVCEDERQARLARVLYKKTEVDNRHTCVPHQVAYNWCQPVDGLASGPRTNLAVPPEVIPQVTGGSSHGPTTLERMRLYADFASDLAVQASQRALASAAMAAGEITHLVTVSCTGFDAPGVDIELIQQLGLPRSTQRINVGFMGCHGAINGLRAALGIATADPHAKVLVCCVELCSLHYRFKWDSEGIVGNALFADGAAAVVLSQAELRGLLEDDSYTNDLRTNDSSISHSPAEESPVDELPAEESTGFEATSYGSAADGASFGDWQLLDTGSLVIADSKQAMSWRVGDHGFEMLLTSEVGDRIEEGLADWLNGWLATHDLALDDIDYWGVHPGGPRILSAVQNSLQLDDAALSTSRHVLQHNGNMSSPTVLFILNEFLSQYAAERRLGGESERRKHCILLAFGPGLVAEIALLSTTPR